MCPLLWSSQVLFYGLPVLPFLVFGGGLALSDQGSALRRSNPWVKVLHLASTPCVGAPAGMAFLAASRFSMKLRTDTESYGVGLNPIQSISWCHSGGVENNRISLISPSENA